MKAALILLAALALAAPAFGGITYNRCSLARKLFSMGVARNELAIWSCIAEHESSYRSWVVGPSNSDGSKDYGLFQINDKYWCQPDNGKFSYNTCLVSCNTLLGDYLRPSLNCARQIKKKQGWGAWSTWQYCNGNLPSIDSCFEIDKV